MSDELKHQVSIGTPEFRVLLSRYNIGEITEAALIAHIDAWGARLAGVPDGWKHVPMEPTERMRQAAASFGHPDAGPSYPEGYSSQRGDEAVEAYRQMIAAAPTPKEDACGS